MPIKSDRNVAPSLEDKKKGQYIGADAVPTEDNSVREVWLESVDFPPIFAKQVFTNEDGSIGVLYLVSGDTGLSYERMTAICQKRRNAECRHKSLKQNAASGKSPTETIGTRTNHFFASVYAYIRLESLKISSKVNHFALKNKLYIKAVQQAFVELQKLQESVGCVR